MIRKTKHSKGIAGLEVMVLIAVLLAIFSVAVLLFLNSGDIKRTNQTRDKLLAIKKALVGDPLKRANKARSSFGFLGDMGILPNDLIYLMERGTYPTYTSDATYPFIRFGWNGPYLDSTKNSDGKDSALVDAWGNSILYTDNIGNPVVSLSTINWPVKIFSCGPDGVSSGDDIIEEINENEVRTYVTGTFKDRTGADVAETSVKVFYPNGTASLQSVTIATGTAFPGKTGYNSYNDAVTNSYRKIPLGIRYMETTDNGGKKLAAFNNGEIESVPGINYYDTSVINFVFDSGLASTTGVIFERTFDGTEDPMNPLSKLEPSGGSWATNASTGSFVANGPVGEYRYIYNTKGINDYRVEVDATLFSSSSITSRGYGIYYRCSDTASNISGYCFQYDPGLASGTNAIAFAVRKVSGGAEQSPFQQVNRTPAQFPYVYGTSHHISITVEGNRHRIRVDGTLIMDFIDDTFLTGNIGLRSWDGNSLTQFHHLLVYRIPPLPDGEIAWWSFEEGNNSSIGNRVFGSGFLNTQNVNENNGAFGTGVTRYGHLEESPYRSAYGQGLYFNGGYITVPNASNLNPTNQMTLEAWVMPVVSNNRGDIVMKGGGYGFWQNNSNSHVNGGWNAQIQIGSTIVPLCWGGARVVANEWKHLALTYDGNIVRFYVDGSQVDSSNITGSITSNSNSFLISDSGFRGYIDEVFLYNKALSAAQIYSRYSKNKDNVGK